VIYLFVCLSALSYAEQHIVFGNFIANDTIPGINLWINGTKVASNLGYLQFATVDGTYPQQIPLPTQVTRNDTDAPIDANLNTPVPGINTTLSYFTGVNTDHPPTYQSEQTEQTGGNIRVHHQAANAPALIFTLYDNSGTSPTPNPIPHGSNSAFHPTTSSSICIAIATTDLKFFVPDNCWVIQSGVFYDVVLTGDYYNSEHYPLFLYIYPHATATGAGASLFNSLSLTFVVLLSLLTVLTM